MREFTESRFLFVGKSTNDARYNTLCRFAVKAYTEQHPIYIHCADQKEAMDIDRLLWTFSDTSFLPHQLLDNNAVSPIIIGYNAITDLKNHDILVNLNLTPPDFFLQFKRVVEIVSADASKRTQARENYRFYRAQGCEINSHHLS